MIYQNGVILIESLGWSITIIDLAVVLFALILSFVGMSKGFTKLFFSLFGTLAVIIGAVLLAKTVGGWLEGPFGHFVQDPASNWIGGMDVEGQVPVFNQVFDWTNAGVRDEMIPLVLSRMGLPATLAGIITNTGMFNSLFESFGNAALVDVLPQAITSLAMTIIAFVLLLIVLSIVMFFIRRIFEGLTSFRLFGGLNRLLGFALGLAQAYLIVSVLLTIVSYFPSEGFLSSVYQQIDNSVVTKFLVENNWIGNWLINTILPH